MEDATTLVLESAPLCIPCAVGYYSANPGSFACSSCAAGSANPTPGSTSCEVCPAGKTTAGVAAATCEACALGTFKAAAGLGVCSDCPGNDYSTSGATACNRCLRGFYFSATATCEACPSGTICSDDGGATQEVLTLAKGYWRISPWSVDVQACRLSSACVGGVENASAADQRRRLLGESFSDVYCAKGYTGPLCGVCDPNGFYLNPDAQACQKCNKGSEAAAFFTPTMTIFLVMALVAICCVLFVFLIGGANFGVLKGHALEMADKAENIKTKGQALVKAANTFLGDGPSDVHFNKDGSVTVTQSETVEVPPHTKELVLKMSTGVFDATATTIVATKASLEYIND